MEACLQEALSAFAGTRTADASSAVQPSTLPIALESDPTSSSSGSTHADAMPPDTPAAADGATEEQQNGNAPEQAAAQSAFPTVASAVEPVSWDAASSAAACAACRARAARHQQDASALYDSIRTMVDAATAHVLHVRR